MKLYEDFARFDDAEGGEGGDEGEGGGEDASDGDAGGVTVTMEATEEAQPSQLEAAKAEKIKEEGNAHEASVTPKRRRRTPRRCSRTRGGGALKRRCSPTAPPPCSTAVRAPEAREPSARPTRRTGACQQRARPRARALLACPPTTHPRIPQRAQRARRPRALRCGLRERARRG